MELLPHRTDPVVYNNRLRSGSACVDEMMLYVNTLHKKWQTGEVHTSLRKCRWGRCAVRRILLCVSASRLSSGQQQSPRDLQISPYSAAATVYNAAATV